MRKNEGAKNKIMKKALWNQVQFTFFAACIGGVIGVFIWAFLKVMGIGQDFLFVDLPKSINLPYLTLITCVAGGLLIGVYEKIFHASPEELETVMAAIKRDGSYSCDRLGIRAVGAILPLIFGASIGPEAGLTGIIAGLCFWAGERFRYVGKHLSELSQIGMGAVLGVIFKSPLFGFMMPIEDGEMAGELARRDKMLAYVASILGGFGAYSLLSHLFGGGMGIVRLEGNGIGSRERIFAVVLIAVGILAGILYTIFLQGAQKLFVFLNKKAGVIFCTVLGGLCIGLFGTYVPYSMFSGEAQMEELAQRYMEYAPVMLLLIGMAKLLITNISIQSGFKGGNFFPVIFAGVSIGYGAGLICSVSPVFAAAAVTAALLGFLMKKPVAVVLLLMLCFPAEGIVWMLLAAEAGSCVQAFLDSTSLFKRSNK